MMGRKTNIGFQVRTLDNMLMRNFACSVKESGLDELTVMHGWSIGYLYQNRERDIYQKDIESQFSIGRSTVTNILKLMEKKRISSERAGEPGCQAEEAEAERYGNSAARGHSVSLSCWMKKPFRGSARKSWKPLPKWYIS